MQQTRKRTETNLPERKLQVRIYYNGLTRRRYDQIGGGGGGMDCLKINVWMNKFGKKIDQSKRGEKKKKKWKSIRNLHLSER